MGELTFKEITVQKEYRQMKTYQNLLKDKMQGYS